MPSLEDRSGLQRKVARSAGRRPRYQRPESLPKVYGCNLQQICSHSPAAVNQILCDAVSSSHHENVPFSDDSPLPEGAIKITSFFLKLTALP